MRDKDSNARRIANFQVRAFPSRDPAYQGEITMEYTTNGFQWNVVGLLPQDIVKVIAALTPFAAGDGKEITFK